MSTAVFPDIFPSFGYMAAPGWRTLRIGPTDGDFTQRRRKRTSPLFRFNLPYRGLTQSQEKQIRDFHTARSGGFQSFIVFDFDSKDSTGIAVATGDGVTTSFDLGGKQLSSVVVYQNSSVLTAGVDYNISTAAGSYGQDIINFPVAAPSTAAVITADFHGRRVHTNVLFESDEFPPEVIDKGLYSFNLALIQVTT